MSNACAFCQTKESTTMGKWFVRPDCAGRRSPPSVLREKCADRGFASSVGAWSLGASGPFRRNNSGMP